MSYTNDFRHFTGKRKSPCESRKKKKPPRAKKQHSNRYERYSKAPPLPPTYRNTGYYSSPEELIRKIVDGKA